MAELPIVDPSKLSGKAIKGIGGSDGSDGLVNIDFIFETSFPLAEALELKDQLKDHLIDSLQMNWPLFLNNLMAAPKSVTKSTSNSGMTA